MAVSETHLTGNKNFTMPNYQVYRSDRLESRGGGAMLLVKNSIQSNFVSRTDNFFTQTISIKIKTKKYSNILVTGIYNRPQNIITEQFLMQFFPSDCHALILGDLNAKNTLWGCNKTNKNGQHMDDIIHNNDLYLYMPNSPTFYHRNPAHEPEYLDFLISNFPLNNTAVTFNELNSDHLPVLYYTDEPSPNNTKTVQVTDYELLHNILQLVPLPTTNIRSTESIEAVIKDLTFVINTAKSEATTIKTIHKNYIKLPKTIRDLIKIRNRARKQYQQSRHPDDKATYNSINRHVKIKIQQYREESWASKLAEIAENDRNLWALSKFLKKDKIINTPLQSPQGLTYDSNLKANIFAESLENQFKENEEPRDDDVNDVIDIVHRCYFDQGQAPPPVQLPVITPAEIKEQIKKLKNKKAAGPDGITNEVLKSLPQKYISRIATIFNKCLSFSYFPQCWKEATVILIPKPGKDISLPESHRPISLLSNLGKLFEKHIQSRLQPFLTFIPNHQFGFRKKHGTAQQLLNVTNYIASAIKNKQIVVLLSVDLEKAFDRISHKILLYKLISYNIPSNLVHFLKSYLYNRNFKVKVGNAFSNSKPIHASIAQGSILGPTLFNIYVSDFPVWQDPNHKTVMYADDTMLIQKSYQPTTATRKLQEKIQEVEKWCAASRIKINGKKSQVIIIRRYKYNRPFISTLKIFNESVQKCKTIKYLGVTLNQRLTWKPHIDNVIKKARIIKSKLQNIIGRKSKLKIASKRKLYTSTLRPILTYAAAAWANITSHQFKPLETYQNITLRQITNARWFMKNYNLRRDLNIPTVKNFIRKINRKFCINNATSGPIQELFTGMLTAGDEKLNPICAMILKDPILRKKFGNLIV